MFLPSAYFDTSVLLKRYLDEPGAAQARALLRRYRILTSTLTSVEALSALVRRHRAGQLSPMDLERLAKELRRDREGWDVAEVDTEVLMKAEVVVRSANVRTLDAIHLGTVLIARVEARGLPLVTADRAQREAASLLGLAVEWVG